MVKAIGTDSGIKSYDLFGFDDETGEILADEAIDREKITRDPGLVIRRLREIQKKYGKIDAIAASSGYGVPLKKASKATDTDIALATFVTEKDIERRLKIVGLRELMKLMREAHDLNVYFTPGAIHLPTISTQRKANRIDMGTSDKVYTVALAIRDQSERLGIKYGETSLIAVEIGFSYTSAMAVKQGRIADAMAGTSGFPGYSGMGFMDSELAYALANTVKDFSKTILFQGGAGSIAGLDTLKKEPGEFIRKARTDKNFRMGYDVMQESIVKDVASLLPSVVPREIILSGRFVRIPEFLEDITDEIKKFFNSIGISPKIVKLNHKGKISKEAAEGAAIVANGLAGGKYKKLADNMKLRDAKGTVFDYIHLDVAGEMKRKYGI